MCRRIMGSYASVIFVRYAVGPHQIRLAMDIIHIALIGVQHLSRLYA